jgi:hypothetical protein
VIVIETSTLVQATLPATLIPLGGELGLLMKVGEPPHV